MELAELKPLLTTLVMPPAGPVLLAMAGLLLARRAQRTGLALTWTGLLGGWLLSCHAVALWLSAQLLPQLPAVTPEQMRQVQAVIVLGGGSLPATADWGTAQPDRVTAARLRYGAWLARENGLPLGFAGGVGWASVSMDGVEAEAVTAARMAREWGQSLRWADSTSRDTAENASRMAALLQPDGIRRIALVTDAWHLPRAVRHFQAAGLQVLPAPTGLPVPRARAVLEWLPSGDGVQLSRQVLRERLAWVLL